MTDADGAPLGPPNSGFVDPKPVLDAEFQSELAELRERLGEPTNRREHGQFNRARTRRN